MPLLVKLLANSTRIFVQISITVSLANKGAIGSMRDPLLKNKSVRKEQTLTFGLYMHTHPLAPALTQTCIHMYIYTHTHSILKM